MKLSLILLASSAVAIPLSEQKDATKTKHAAKHAIKNPQQLHKLADRIQNVSKQIKAAPRAKVHIHGEAGSSQGSSGGSSVNALLISVLESVEDSISGIIQYLEASSGEPTSEPTGYPTSPATQSMVPPVSSAEPTSGMDSMSSMPPIPSSMSMSMSMSMSDAASVPTVGPSQAEPTSTTTVTSESTVVQTLAPASNTTAPAAAPSAMLIKRVTTLLPIPVPSSDVPLPTNLPNGQDGADLLENFLRWLVHFLDTQVQQSTTSNEGLDGVLGSIGGIIPAHQ